MGSVMTIWKGCMSGRAEMVLIIDILSLFFFSFSLFYFFVVSIGLSDG